MAMVKDPVCGMEFDSSQAEAQTIYKGQHYFFCSADCRRTFEQSPKEFLKGASGSDEALAKEASGTEPPESNDGRLSGRSPGI